MPRSADIARPELPDCPTPATDSTGQAVPFDPTVFGPTPAGEGIAYDPRLELSVYGGKYQYPQPSPWPDEVRGLYRPESLWMMREPGQVPTSLADRWLISGDYRLASAYNEQLGSDALVFANRLNLDVDFQLTPASRVHGFWGPLNQNEDYTRVEYEHNDWQFYNGLSADPYNLYYAGDLGSMLGSVTSRGASYEMPIALGRIPLLFQNGVWMQDAVTGAATTLHSRTPNGAGIGNYDLTLFVGLDDLNTAALTDDDAGNVYGLHAYFDVWGGHLETGYGYVDDTTSSALSYHNIGLAYTRQSSYQYANTLRYIGNVGQSPDVTQTADGHLVALETAFRRPGAQSMIPYLNLFAGFDRPQSLGRAPGSGGILRNTGINFESDFLTAYPTLDATAQNTMGGALGLNMLGPVYDYQLVMELAWLQPFNQQSGSSVPGDQYGLGLRYQLPLSDAIILRMDAMHGFMQDLPDVTGARTELRFRF